MSKKTITKDELELRELIKPFLKRWYWFLFSICIALILAVLYILYTPPVYKMQTSVLIKDAKKMSSAAGDFSVLAGLGGITGMGTNSIENEIEVFKSKKIVEDAILDLNLQTSIYSREKFYDVELFGDTSPVNIILVKEKQYEELPKEPINFKIEGDKITLSSEEFKNDIVTTYNKLISLPYADFIITKNKDFNPRKTKKLNLEDLYFTYTDLESLSNDLQEELEIELLDKDATVIGISMGSENKDKGKALLNRIVKIYNGYAITDKNVESKKTKDFIDERISIISNELGDVETQKERFKINNDIVDIPTETRINLQLSTEARRKALELDTQIELVNMLLGHINSPNNKYQVLPNNIGMETSSSNGAMVSSNLGLYNAAVMERNRLLENATPENPLVIEKSKEIDALRNGLKESLLKSKTSYEIAKRSVVGEQNATDYKISKVPNQEKLFRGIERQQQIKENLYLLLLQKREEAAISMAITADKARVLDSAFSSKKPIAPKKILVLLGAIIIGCVFPFAYIYIKELLNNKLISRHDLDKLTDSPIIAEIPRLNDKDNSLIQMNDVSPLAESFRILVTNINFMLPKKEKGKIIFVTSTVKGEGKTFVSVNLSLALATPSRKVLVIGSDIRNPQLQRYDHSKKGALGLTEYLYGNVNNASTIIHPSGFNPNCDFIYSGSIPPNPAELLQNGRYNQLLDEVKDQYDYIILDTAPLMLVTDSFLIADVADATVYITRSEVTEKEFLDFANKNIEASKIKNVAFVLNDIHKANFGYGNKYGYGYQAESQTWLSKLKSWFS